MLTLPASPQASCLVSAAQAQPLAACNPSEQSKAVEGQPQEPVRNPAATSQEPFASVRDISPASAIAVAEVPVGMHHQPCDPVHDQLSTASRQEASSQPAHGLSDSMLDGEAACITDSRINSAVGGRMDSGTDSGMDGAVCAAASDVGGQHHSCSGAGPTGALRAGQDSDVARCELDIHSARQEKLASVYDRLGSNPIAASACAVDSSTCSATSSIACSIASRSTACSEGSTGSSEGHASPVPSQPMIAVKPLADNANPGSSDPTSAQPRTTDAQTDMQPPNSNMLPAQNPRASAAAMCHDIAPVASAVDSSALDDAQASSAPGSVTTSSARSPCEVWQKAGAGAGQADSLSVVPASTIEAGLAQPGCAASPSARVAHGDFTSSGQSQVVLQGAREAPMPAEPPVCSPLQLLAPGTGGGLTGASAQLGNLLAGTSPSIMTGLQLESSKVAAAVATAVCCEAQTEVVEIGVQTDASVSPCMLDTGTKSGCSGIDCVVELQADTQSVGSAHSVSASESSSHSGPVARQAAASHGSLPAKTAAESRSAMGSCLTKYNLASSPAHASKADGNATGASGNPTCLSNVAATQTDALCQAAAQAGLCSTAQSHSESEQCTSNSEKNAVLNQAPSFWLELVTACDGHVSLKELIRADMCCFSYESDSCLMTVCGQITDTLTHDSL